MIFYDFLCGDGFSFKLGTQRKLGTQFFPYQVSGFLGFWVSGFLRFLGFWVSELLDFWVSGFLAKICQCDAKVSPEPPHSLRPTEFVRCTRKQMGTKSWVPSFKKGRVPDLKKTHPPPGWDSF